MYYWRLICMRLCPEPCKLHVTAVKNATTRIVSAAYRLACATLHQIRKSSAHWGKTPTSTANGQVCIRDVRSTSKVIVDIDIGLLS
jgi:hypothetical protein